MCGSVNPYFAVKKLKEDDEEAFKEELESLKRLGSKEQPHLVKLLATYEQKGSYYLIFPWADGGNLRHLWEKFPKPNITYQDHVKKKHGAHGDLKPENILWFQDPLLGDGTRVKFEPKGVSRTYCAPEFDVKGHISQKYDMWTLG
ncbi:putative protein kinase domain-containing protein [Eutypa lata UCREL1]|uniref:Protein kinase domain-containing protein n=1 Tax=Eutypa lata (strain UCR-EL1) TaxID=1287681 RepID=M7TCB9_EUTLA|nr:putative protein kinase domain-containing protein [Eutypa lata UCREL1]